MSLVVLAPGLVVVHIICVSWVRITVTVYTV